MWGISLGAGSPHGLTNIPWCAHPRCGFTSAAGDPGRDLPVAGPLSSHPGCPPWAGWGRLGLQLGQPGSEK